MNVTRSCLPLPILALLVSFTLLFPLSRRACGDDPAGTWKAGVARVNITPDQPMWMSGYAARTKPAEGKQTDLWAKALVLEDPTGHRGVFVTIDLVGIDRKMSLAVRQELQKRHGLP